ncbi:hypothetical protein B0H13DRAFT_2318377 [Mycena leptocephala]|nr:hypothetical protein B0H13DRAFT_2318377 [Mycena leptocephala]
MLQIQEKSVEYDPDRKLSLILKFIPAASTTPSTASSRSSGVVGTRGKKAWQDMAMMGKGGIGSVSKEDCSSLSSFACLRFLGRWKPGALVAMWASWSPLDPLLPSLAPVLWARDNPHLLTLSSSGFSLLPPSPLVLRRAVGSVENADEEARRLRRFGEDEEGRRVGERARGVEARLGVCDVEVFWGFAVVVGVARRRDGRVGRRGEEFFGAFAAFWVFLFVEGWTRRGQLSAELRRADELTDTRTPTPTRG